MNHEELKNAILEEDDLAEVTGGTELEYRRYLAKMKKKYNEKDLGMLMWMMTPEENDVLNQWFNHKPGEKLDKNLLGTLN